MKTYFKKHIGFQAIQWTGENQKEIHEFIQYKFGELAPVNFCIAFYSNDPENLKIVIEGYQTFYVDKDQWIVTADFTKFLVYYDEQFTQDFSETPFVSKSEKVEIVRTALEKVVQRLRDIHNRSYSPERSSGRAEMIDEVEKIIKELEGNK